MRAAFGSVWEAEERGRGSVVGGILRGATGPPHLETEYELGRIREAMQGISVYGFKGGMEKIVRSLEGSLRNDPRIEVRVGDSVHAVRRSRDNIVVGTPIYNIYH
jgi:oxygen-dependent protoporphyrinogen oxidase